MNYSDSAAEAVDVAQGRINPSPHLTHRATEGPLFVKPITTQRITKPSPGRDLYYAVQHAYTILPFPFRRSGRSSLPSLRPPRETQHPLSPSLTLDPHTRAERYTSSTIASKCETIFIPILPFSRKANETRKHKLPENQTNKRNPNVSQESSSATGQKTAMGVESLPPPRSRRQR